MQGSNYVFGSYLSPRSTSNREFNVGISSSSLKNSDLVTPNSPNRMISSSALESLQQVGYLSTEVERLNELNCALILENESLKARMDKSKREVELETKIKILATENERLAGLLADPKRTSSFIASQETQNLLTEIDSWKEKYAQVEPMIIDLQDRLNQLMFERELEMDQMTKLEKDNQNLKNRLTDALDSILLLTEDNKKLKTVVQTPRFEGSSIGAIKNEIRESLGAMGTTDNAEKERKMYEAEAKKKMIEEMSRLRKECESKESQIVELREELEAVTHMSKEMEEKFNELFEERFMMNKNLQDAQFEVERIAEQNVILEEDNKRLFEALNSIQTEKMELQNQFRNQINVVRAEDVQRYQTKISELQKQSQSLQDEVKKLQSEVASKSTEIENLKKNVPVPTAPATEVKMQPFVDKINQLVDELRQTNSVIIEKSNQEAALKKKIMDLEKEKATNSEQMMIKMQQVLREMAIHKQEAKEKRQENEILCLEIRRLNSRSFENVPLVSQSLEFKEKHAVLRETSKSILNEVEGLRSQMEEFKKSTQSPYPMGILQMRSKSELDNKPTF